MVGKTMWPDPYLYIADQRYGYCTNDIHEPASGLGVRWGGGHCNLPAGVRPPLPQPRTEATTAFSFASLL